MAPPGEEPLYGEELSEGALAGDWVVERVQYRGPVSTLYRARELRTGAPAALKVLRSQLLDGTALRRFRREAATLQRLKHPHIVGILGYGELVDGRPFIAMEWLEGRDLAAELAARGPLSPREALEVLEQVGAALRAAHGAGVVHRDLKAQNVMRLQGEGETPAVKLVDFGVAKGLTPEAPGASTLTHTGTVLGTPLAMAPEQIRGQVPDIRTDLYALGVLLFQLVTGHPPFQGSTRHEVEEQHLHAPPPRASEHAPVPPALDAVVLRCLEKRREDRYPDVDTLLEELRHAVRGAPGPARPRRAVALYVEALVEGTPDEAALERVDTLLEHAGAAAREAGLKVRVEGACCLAAVAPLTEEPAAELAVRGRVLSAMLALTEGVGALPSPPRVTLAVTAHVDALPSEESGRPLPPGAGNVLRLKDWAAHPLQGLVATAPALRGLEGSFHVEPVPELPGRWRITGRR
jgi:eukaryotic-like serine/threonine-protein kinase